VDQRKHKRYRVKEGVFAWFEGDAGRLGQIVDISRGGLAFQYVSDTGASNGPHELGIFLADNDFRLDGIPSRIVSDIDVSEPRPFSTVPLRRCGLQFEDLDPAQLSQLEHLLEEHAKGEAPNF
jgi:hypothetical protein